MVSRHRMERKLGWLLACLLTAGVACDDDTAADTGAEHNAEHAEAGEHDASHGATAGAGEHDHEHAGSIGPATGATCPDDSTLTYENFGQQFMEDYCLRCHGEDVTGDARKGAPDDHNFTDWMDIMVLSNHIDQYAGSGPDATNEMMPPSDPKPPLEERQKLSEWIACGAPKN